MASSRGDSGPVAGEARDAFEAIDIGVPMGLNGVASASLFLGGE